MRSAEIILYAMTCAGGFLVRHFSQKIDHLWKMKDEGKEFL
jgi:hypothetical protein